MASIGRKTVYIGLANTFHDGALALVDFSGKVIFAEATERILQNKRSIGAYPDQYGYVRAVVDRFCDPDSDVVVGISWGYRTPEALEQKLRENDVTAKALRAKYGSEASAFRRELNVVNFICRAQYRQMVHCGNLLEYEVGRAYRNYRKVISTRYYSHHLAHAAAGCYTSAFEAALCVVLDGYGEHGAVGCYEYRHGQLMEMKDAAIASTGSLGMFYSVVCDLCGFDYLSGEEWKVMGLAGYGQVDDELYVLLRRLIKVDGTALVAGDTDTLVRVYRSLDLYRRRQDEGALSVADIAKTGQFVFEELLCEFLNSMNRFGSFRNLVLAGGCALNSSANGLICNNTNFDNLYVFCAPGDDGNAVWAAMLAYFEDQIDTYPTMDFQSPYLGSRMSKESLNRLVMNCPDTRVERCGSESTALAAALLSEGKIIGWIKDRAEFGPRALGNRSILADPRPRDIKERINAKVKFREEFRPFAPAILHEHGKRYFAGYETSPYMERALPFRNNVRDVVPGVVHVDGTGRLQSVKSEWNAEFYELIDRFRDITGIPLVLNTSFNVMGKPIAHSVEDAVAVFYTSGLDALFVDNVVVAKREQRPGKSL